MADEQRLAESFERQTRFGYVQTPKSSHAVCDALLLKNGILAGIAETKCRYDIPSVEHFAVDYDGLWLVTWDKITRNCALAEQLCVPFFGVLFLVEPSVFLVKRIYEGATREWVADIQVKRTKTQATINGGVAERANAYIDMNSARQYAL